MIYHKLFNINNNLIIVLFIELTQKLENISICDLFCPTKQEKDICTSTISYSLNYFLCSCIAYILKRFVGVLNFFLLFRM